MEVLIIGGGGREHAIATALKKSPKITKLYVAPSNAGINAIAEGVDIGVMDFPAIANFLDSNKKIKLTVVAPDNPLADGLVNYLEDRGHRVFGPTKEAATIEGSKVFAKTLMKQNNIPTAGYQSFEDYKQAESYVKKAKYPLVIKADGLAYGKGVIICGDINSALSALKEIMLDASFGSQNTTVVIEEFLVGREVSILAFTDGKTIVPMISSQDHKKAYDGDKGANTGGMGAFAPSPYYTENIQKKTLDKIILPTIDAMNKMGRKFKGVLYFGLMICNGEPYVLEYNARFGDPEAQAVLPLLETDLYEIMESIVDERLSEMDIKWKDMHAVTVVLASKGYPASYQTGKEITIYGDNPLLPSDITIYHAGTKEEGGKLLTSGGRVMAVTALGKSIAEAREKVYKAIEEKISFEGMFFRRDIGKEL